MTDQPKTTPNPFFDLPADSTWNASIVVIRASLAALDKILSSSQEPDDRLRRGAQDWHLYEGVPPRR